MTKITPWDGTIPIRVERITDADELKEREKPEFQLEDTARTDKTLEETTEPQEPKADLLPPTPEQTPSLALPSYFKPIPVPDAPAITQALQLARALRPFARQVEVGVAEDIDEAATVEQIAETGVWQPVLKPASELWLDVALVFDTSPSMALWQKLDKELQRLLSRYGEFRDVRLWRLRPTASGVQFTTHNNVPHKNVPHKPSELLTGDRRRLVVVISDCVGRAWHNGQMRESIGIWSEKLPTVILQVFPEWLWSRTALARSLIVELQGKQAGLPSNQLVPTVRSVWDRQRLAQRSPEHPVLPVVSIDPEAFADLAAVVTGNAKARVLGMVWDAEPVAYVNDPKAEPPSLKDSIDSFVLSASPTARNLAALLVSAPAITLPIVRSIKTSMLPRTSAVHMAEVLMSGLFKLSSAEKLTYDNAEWVAYEVIDAEVRDRLRAGTRVIDARDVVEAVSEYVAKGLGKSLHEFWALLHTPNVSTPSEETQFLQAFATVTAQVLRGLGGEFTRIADELEQGQRTARQMAREQDFLTRLREEASTVEVGSLTILAGEEEGQFLALRERFAGVNLEDGELYELQQQGIESGITIGDIDAQVGFIFDQLVARINLPEWQGETVFVNRRGEIIERQSVTAKYYEEEIPPAPLIKGGGFSRGDQPPPELTTLKMLLIPAGTLLKEKKRIFIKPFFMSQTPITQAQWWAIATRTDLKVKNNLKPNPSRFNEDFKETSHWLRPVEEVSWYDAIEFCARLAKLTQSPYSLPTEAQWEYGCHGLREPPESEEYAPFHYGETLTVELANYNSNYTFADEEKMESPGQTTPVGSYPPNVFGLQDMHGNVWEWSIDLWESEENPINNDSINLKNENITIQLLNDKRTRSIRGGSWDNYPRVCGSTSRNWFFPGNRFFSDGFRVVCRFPRT